jgi:hypothetical protein
LNASILKDNKMKKLEFIKVILSIVIILMIFYSLYIYIYENDDLINWLNTLISTIISVLLALMIAIYIFYYQTNLIQKETKNKFIPLIEMELTDIWKSLSNLINPMKVIFSDGKELDFYATIFPDIIFEQAICSNVFNQEQTRFLLAMKCAINFNRRIIEQFINMNPRIGENPDNYKKSLEFLHINHEKSIKDLKKNILLANKYFEFNELDKETKKNSSNTQ